MARLTNIRIRRSATPGNIPTTAQLDLGELALNTFDGKLYLKKDVNGTESVVEVGASANSQQSGVWKEYVYTATSNQTSFSGLDDNSNTLSYVPDYLQVFLNGILLDNGTDYTANTSSSVVLVNGANSGDLLQVATFTRMVGSADIAVDTFTPDGNTSVFSLSGNPDVEENVQVYIDGVYQEQSTYTITSGNILTLDSNPPSGTTLEVSIGTRNVTLDNLEDLNISGDLTVAGAIVADITGTVSSLSNHDTGDLAEGTNLYFTEERVDDRVSSLIVGGSGITTSYDDIAGTLTVNNIIEDEAQFNTNNIIPQVITSTTVASTSATTIATHSASTYRTIKYLVQCTQGTDYHSTEITLIHDGTTVYITEYGTLFDNVALGTFDATISSGNIILQITAGSAISMDVKVISSAIPL